MEKDFPEAMAFTEHWEGYKSNIVGDVGGRTIYGICERYFPKEVAAMVNMTAQDARAYAEAFYRKEFWDHCGCDDLPYPLDVVAFDCSVNPGPNWCAHHLLLTRDWRELLNEREAHYRLVAHANVLQGLINRSEALKDKYKEY